MIEHVKGNVIFEDDLIVSDVGFTIYKVSTGKLYKISGYFELTKNNQFSFAEHNKCNIVLDDGRQGIIIPTNFDGFIVNFTVSGCLDYV